MAAMGIEQGALSLLQTFEDAGRQVARVVVDGRKIEVVLHAVREERDEFEGIDMRHGKT